MPKYNLIILIGILNAKRRKKTLNNERCLGNEATGKRNENGEFFVSFVELNNLIIRGSYFKVIHKLARVSSNGLHWHQIYHAAIN